MSSGLHKDFLKEITELDTKEDNTGESEHLVRQRLQRRPKRLWKRKWKKNSVLCKCRQAYTEGDIFKDITELEPDPRKPLL